MRDELAAFYQWLESYQEEIKSRAESFDSIRDKIRDSLHPGQRRIFDDTSESKSVVTTRRFGKSVTASAMGADSALAEPGKPGDPIGLYIADTAENARALLAKNLNELKKHVPDLEWREWTKNSRQYFVFPNGATIWAAGVPDKPQVRVFRGFGYRFVIVDETQNVPDPILNELIQEVIEPAITETKGWFLMIGTPGSAPVGTYYETSTGKREGWASFTGMMWENPYLWAERDPRTKRLIEDPETLTEEVCRERFEKLIARRKLKNRWKDDEPKMLREYYGRWVSDAGLAAFPYDPEVNAHHEGIVFDPSEWLIVIAADVATSGTSAWAVVAAKIGHPEKYILHTEQHKGVANIRQFANITKRLQSRYRAERVIIDSDGPGAGYVANLRDLFGLHAEKAAKRDKLANVHGLRGDMMAGKVLVVQPDEQQALLDEWKSLAFDREGGLWPKHHPDHIADAVLYAWRHLRTWEKEGDDEPEPELGSDEWFAKRAAEIREQARELSSRRYMAKPLEQRLQEAVEAFS